ncbi:MAG: hypothetical protein E7546_01380 [Ruminococcaceae bacterium]|nr:hypothetical protein [Oscillospiraceae bacterium]
MKNAAKNRKSYIESQYASGRSTLLMALILSAVNIVLGLTGSDSAFLFTAFLPYVSTILPKSEVVWGLDGSVRLIAYGILPIVAWLACWFLSKNNRKIWMPVATALFILDSVYLASFVAEYGIGDGTFTLLNIVFHVYILFVLIRACIAGNKLEKGAFEPDVTEVQGVPAAAPVAAAPVATAPVAADPAEATVVADAAAEQAPVQE